MKLPITVVIDLNRPKKHVVHLEQGDAFTRWIDLILLLDGVPYDPTDDLVAIGAAGATDEYIDKSVAYLKPNGVGGEYSKIPEGGSTDAVQLMDGETNRYIVYIDEHATDVPGFTELFVRFSVTDTLGRAHIFHSFPITLEVGKVLATNTDPSQPYFADFVRKSAQAAKTGLMTSAVGIDASGKLWTAAGGGGGEFLVKEVSTGVTDYSASDIITAKNGGMVVRLKSRQGIEYDLEAIDTTNQRVTFSTSISGGTIIVQSTAVITNNAVVYTSLSGYVMPSGGIPETDLAVYETTITENSGYSANHSLSDILTAYNAHSILKFKMGDNPLYVDELTNSVIRLHGIDATIANAPELIQLEITSTGVTGTHRIVGYPAIETVTGDTPSINYPVQNTQYECSSNNLSSLSVTNYQYGVCFAILFHIQPNTTPSINFDSRIQFPDGHTWDPNYKYEVNVNGHGLATVQSWVIVD